MKKALNAVAYDERHSGLPCRGGCEQVFKVERSATLPQLLAAGAARTLHELRKHAYTHVAVTLYGTYHGYGKGKH